MGVLLCYCYRRETLSVRTISLYSDYDQHGEFTGIMSQEPNGAKFASSPKVLGRPTTQLKGGKKQNPEI